MTDETEEELDLNDLDDTELVEQMHDDLYDGLREEVVCAGIERLGLVELAVLGGEHEDRDVGRFGVLFEGSADFQSAHSGQHEIQDNDVRTVAANGR